MAEDTQMVIQDQAPLATFGAGGIVQYDIHQALEQADSNIKAILEFVNGNFEYGIDYGVPFKGSDKKTLLKPGAEKIDLLFNVRPSYLVVSTKEDYETGFAIYHFKCQLVNRATSVIMGEGDGSCNSYESKYRWRQAERTCPKCQAQAIFRSKKSGEGWYCWNKKGGCGAQFAANDPSIVGQETGRTQNPDIFDSWNTVLKMAQKRSLVNATLSMGILSGLFTQDAEDFVGDSGGDDIIVDTSTGEILSKKQTVAKTSPNSQPPKEPAPTTPKPPIPAPPVTEPVIEPTIVKTEPEPAQPVKMVKIWDGKNFSDKPADTLVAQGSIDWYNRKFVNGIDPDTYNVWGKDKMDAQFHLFGNPNQRGSDGKRSNYGHIGKYYFDDKHNPKVNLKQLTYAELADLIAYSWWTAGVKEEGKGYLALPRYQDKIEVKADEIIGEIPTDKEIYQKASALGIENFESTLKSAYFTPEEMSSGKELELMDFHRQLAWKLLTQIEQGVIATDDWETQVMALSLT